MNFDFTEEQVMLRDSVARYVQDDYEFDTRRAIANSDEGMSREKWQTFAELGWLSVPFAEEHGGFGGNIVDVMVVMEELGRGLVVEPYTATVLLFGGLIQKGGSAELQADYIPRIIDGSVLGSFAYLERQGRYELSDVKTTATASGDSYKISGEKVVVTQHATRHLHTIMGPAGAQHTEPTCKWHDQAANNPLAHARIQTRSVSTDISPPSNRS